MPKRCTPHHTPLYPRHPSRAASRGDVRAAAGAAESATDTLELTGDNVELVLDQVRPEITGFRTQPQV